MRVPSLAFALTFGLAPAAVAADLVAVTVVRPVPVTVISRPPTLGIGYSAIQTRVGAISRGYPVHVTCTVGRGAFSRAICPTPAYDAYCPSATIVCR